MMFTLHSIVIIYIHCCFFIHVFQIGTYLGFSVTSAIFAVVTSSVYVMGVYNIYKRTDGCEFFLGWYKKVPYPSEYAAKCRTSVALGSMVIIFAILEFGFGIVACICCCLNCRCKCDCFKISTQETQVLIYTHLKKNQNFVGEDTGFRMPIMQPKSLLVLCFE